MLRCQVSGDFSDFSDFSSKFVLIFDKLTKEPHLSLKKCKQKVRVTSGVVQLYFLITGAPAQCSAESKMFQLLFRFDDGKRQLRWNAITYVIGDYQIISEKRFQQIFQEPGNGIKVRGVGNSWAGWAIVVCKYLRFGT